MIQIPIYQADAFTEEIFGGNPAAICPLAQWLPNKTLQAIASENNLSETAFFVDQGDGSYELRWFTPETEVDLCGHATLAAAFILFSELHFPGKVIRFHSRSGILEVTRHENGMLELDFPSRPPQSCKVPPFLIAGLGKVPLEVMKSRDYFIIYESEQDVASLQPTFPLLEKVETLGIIVTAKGNEVDFVSRFFAPRAGINEDPVTGSAHCTLIPYWANVLNKSEMKARQLSKRGGHLHCKLAGNRVKIAGFVRLYMKGQLWVESDVSQL
jgi:predicted PhzF superfamily epimerase YddE/YHI9